MFDISVFRMGVPGRLSRIFNQRNFRFIFFRYWNIYDHWSYSIDMESQKK